MRNSIRISIFGRNRCIFNVFLRVRYFIWYITLCINIFVLKGSIFYSVAKIKCVNLKNYKIIQLKELQEKILNKIIKNGIC